MADVILTDEANAWYEDLSDSDRNAVGRAFNMLETFGIALAHPYSSDIKGSSIALRELRIQGRALRAFYCFDPARDAVVICGGRKAGTSSDRWYRDMTDTAEKIWAQYLREQGF